MDQEAKPASQHPGGGLRVRTLGSRLLPVERLCMVGWLRLPICDMRRAGLDGLPASPRKATMNSLPVRRFAGAIVKDCPIAPSPEQPQIYFLSLYVSLLWTFHINGSYSTWPFMAGFFHLAKCFPLSVRFIHIVAGVNPLFLFIPE